MDPWVASTFWRLWINATMNGVVQISLWDPTLPSHWLIFGCKVKHSSHMRIMQLSLFKTLKYLSTMGFFFLIKLSKNESVAQPELKYLNTDVVNIVKGRCSPESAGFRCQNLFPDLLSLYSHLWKRLFILRDGPLYLESCLHGAAGGGQCPGGQCQSRWQLGLTTRLCSDRGRHFTLSLVTPLQLWGNLRDKRPGWHGLKWQGEFRRACGKIFGGKLIASQGLCSPCL